MNVLYFLFLSNFIWCSNTKSNAFIAVPVPHESYSKWHFSLFQLLWMNFVRLPRSHAGSLKMYFFPLCNLTIITIHSHFQVPNEHPSNFPQHSLNFRVFFSCCSEFWFVPIFIFILFIWLHIIININLEAFEPLIRYTIKYFTIHIRCFYANSLIICIQNRIPNSEPLPVDCHSDPMLCFVDIQPSTIFSIPVQVFVWFFFFVILSNIVQKVLPLVRFLFRYSIQNSRQLSVNGIAAETKKISGWKNKFPLNNKYKQN